MGDTVVEPSVPPTETKEEDSEVQRAPADDIKCTVCMGAEFTQECRIDGCNHSFCFSCISEWVCQALRPSCPMCRKDVDKVSYDFRNDGDGRIEIFIKEYRANQMSLSPVDRAQMFGERRLVVRNIVYAYKLKSQLAAAIAEKSIAEKEDEVIMSSLLDLMDEITQHLGQAESLLLDLRTDLVHKDKAIVCNTLSFRRMIYTLKIKVKYSDLRRPKLVAADVKKNPDRFRGFITEFLAAEFEFIPVNNQPNPGGFQWNTMFLGKDLDAEKKKLFANQIYDLMLEHRPGNEQFQNLLSEILPSVSLNHITVLDDHLEAILSIESTNFTEFYNKVYYDSIYNSFSSNFDYGVTNALRMMREEDGPMPLDAFFAGRRPGGDSWLHEHMFAERIYRQMMSDRTDHTDRATNNDDMSDRSPSPEERVPTPMPDDDYMSIAERLLDHNYDPHPLGTLFATGTIPSLRSSIPLPPMRQRTEEEEVIPQTTFPHRPLVSHEDAARNARLRELVLQSENNMFRPHPMPVLGDPTDPNARRRMVAFSVPVNSRSTATLARIPVYSPSSSTPTVTVQPPPPGGFPPPDRNALNYQFRQITDILNAANRTNEEVRQRVLDRASLAERTAAQRIRRIRFQEPPADAADRPSAQRRQLRYREGNMDVQITGFTAEELAAPPRVPALSTMQERSQPHHEISEDNYVTLRHPPPAHPIRYPRGYNGPRLRFEPISSESPTTSQAIPETSTQEPEIRELQDRADEDAGLDNVSVAHRTRSARRAAAASGQSAGAPTAKRIQIRRE